MDLEQDNGANLEGTGKSLLSPKQERPGEKLATIRRGPFGEELWHVRWPVRRHGRERMRGTSNAVEDLTTTAASTVEEQDGTLAASPPSFCAVSFRGERGTYRFEALIRG
jgi:hypothetical protein